MKKKKTSRLSIALCFALLVSLIPTVKSTASAAENLGTVSYNGTSHTISAPSVTCGQETLTPGTDYYIAYSDNVNAGTCTVEIKGLGKYASVDFSDNTSYFTILPANIGVEVNDATSKPGITPSFSYTIISGQLYNSDTLPTPTYTTSDNGDGSKTITASFPSINNYTIQVTPGTLRISSSANNGLTIDSISSVVYNSMAQQPPVVIRNASGTALSLNTDYSLTYSNNTHAGTATVTATGIGNQAGSSATTTFTIAAKPITVTVEPATITVNQGDGYSYSWSSSQDLYGGDTLGTPVMTLPSTNKAGTYTMSLYFPDANPDYQINIVPGTLIVQPSNTPDNTDYDNGDEPITDNDNGTITSGSGAQTTTAGGQISTGTTEDTDYTILASAGVGGKISPSGAISIKGKQTVSFTITPDSGYKLKAVYVNGKSMNISKATKFQFSNIGANQTVVAEFEKGESAAAVASTAAMLQLQSEGFSIPCGSSALTTADVVTKANILLRYRTSGASTYTSDDSHNVYINSTDLTALNTAMTDSTNENATFPLRISYSKAGYATIYGIIYVTLTDNSTAPSGTGTVIVGTPFTDISYNAWYYDYVTDARNLEYINGTSANTFSPDECTTRGMIVTILYRMEGSPLVVGMNKYKDVSSSAYYADAVRWANANGIITGYTSNTFGPSDYVTREQMAAIMYRFAGLKSYETTTTANLGFSDTKSISSYAETAIKWSVSKKLISGRSNNELEPKGNTTRAEAAAILVRFKNNVAK